jgi:hypothetical protein
LIEREPLGLKDWSFIPFHAQPSHSIEDALHHILGGSLEIRILDAQNKGATGVPGKEPVEEGSARAAYVQVAGRRRCETNARRLGDFWHCSSDAISFQRPSHRALAGSCSLTGGRMPHISLVSGETWDTTKGDG